MRSSKLLWVFVPAFILIAGCKKEPDYVAPDSSFGLIYDQIFATSCALSGCHAEARKKKDVDGFTPYLDGASTYDALINVTPSDGQAATAGLKLVVPNDPGRSFLYQKMTFDSSAYQFGSPMPAGGLTLTANQIEFVRQWIAAGAPLDGHVADRGLMQ